MLGSFALSEGEDGLAYPRCVCIGVKVSLPGCTYDGLTSSVGVRSLVRVGVVAVDGFVAEWARGLGGGTILGWC